MTIQYILDGNGNTTGVYIPIQYWTALRMKYQELDKEIDYSEPLKKEILKGMRQAVNEMNLIKQGKLKAKLAKDFINEL